MLETRVLECLQHFPVVVIQGARQAGKSTMVENLGIEGLTTVTFDPVQDIGGAREDPDLFLQNTRFPVFLDEIQYAPELTASIKRLVDTRGENGLFILSGSQNLAVLRSVSESMAGRAAVLDLLPMSVPEIAGRSHVPHCSTLREELNNEVHGSIKRLPADCESCCCFFPPPLTETECVPADGEGLCVCW